MGSNLSDNASFLWIKHETSTVEFHLTDYMKFAVRYSGRIIANLKLNSVAWVRERTIPTQRPPLVGEVNANFCG
jgi:hypothetical protein